jgi:hypothetical protein
MTHLILLCSTIILFVFIGLFLVVTVQFEQIGRDAGYYIPLSRLVALGLTPFQDFLSSYPPGAYYICALFGRDWLSEPTLTKTIIGAFHVVNIALFLLVLRSFGHSPLRCYFFAAFFGTWILHSDGAEVVLEPFQNFFLLLATLLLLRAPRLYAGLGAGVLTGAALMVKQYSLLAIPGLVFIALRPWEFRNQYPALLNRRYDWPNACLLLIGSAVPFLVFIVTTEQNLLKVFLYLATFGGGAVEYYSKGQSGPYRTLIEFMWNTKIVLPFVLLAACLLAVDRSWRSITLVALFLGSALPLGIRPFKHYVQLVVPWGVLLVAIFCSRLGQYKFAHQKQLKIVLAILISMPTLVLALRNLNEARLAWAFRPVYRQIGVAKAIEDNLQNRKDVLIIGAPWLFYFMDIHPPHLEYGFVKSSTRHIFSGMLDDTKAVILQPTSGFPEVEADRWLTQAGFRMDKRLSLDREEFLIYRNRGDTPPLP